VPPEACASRADLQRWAAECGSTLAFRDKWGGVGMFEGHRSELMDGPRFPPFVVGSYAWLSPEHPDPDGRQLREVLAPAIEWYMSERARYIYGDVNDRDAYGPAREEAKLAAPFTAEGVDFGMFIDFTCMWQKDSKLFDATQTPGAQPASERASFLEDMQAGRRFLGGEAYEASRTAEEKASFGRALQSMDLLYAHQETTVWRLTRLLDGYEGAKPYDDRGWPFFETAAAQYIKPAWSVLDLGSEGAVAALSEYKGEVFNSCTGRVEECVIRYQGVLRAPEALAKQGTYHRQVEPGVIGVLKDRRLPPLVPDEFEARAASKALTNGKDKQALLRMQKEVSTTVLGGVRELRFVQLGWGNDDALLLAKALGLCRSLALLDVSHNGDITGDAAQQLASAALGVATLDEFSGIPVKALREDSVTELSLEYKDVGVIGGLVLAAALLAGSRSLTELRLDCNDLRTRASRRSATL